MYNVSLIINLNIIIISDIIYLTNRNEVTKLKGMTYKTKIIINSLNDKLDTEEERLDCVLACLKQYPDVLTKWLSSNGDDYLIENHKLTELFTILDEYIKHE